MGSPRTPGTAWIGVRGDRIGQDQGAPRATNAEVESRAGDDELADVRSPAGCGAARWQSQQLVSERCDMSSGSGAVFPWHSKHPVLRIGGCGRGEGSEVERV